MSELFRKARPSSYEIYERVKRGEVHDNSTAQEPNRLWYQTCLHMFPKTFTHVHRRLQSKLMEWILKNVVKYHVLQHNMKSIVFGQTIITTGICLYIIEVYKVRLSNYYCGLYEDGRWWFIFMYMHVMGVEHVHKHYLKVNINYWRGEIVRLKLISFIRWFSKIKKRSIFVS